MPGDLKCPNILPVFQNATVTLLIAAQGRDRIKDVGGGLKYLWVCVQNDILFPEKEIKGSQGKHEVTHTETWRDVEILICFKRQAPTSKKICILYIFKCSISLHLFYSYYHPPLIDKEGL